MITLKAKTADPDLSRREIDDGERIENRSAAAATEWGVRKSRSVREGF